MKSTSCTLIIAGLILWNGCLAQITADSVSPIQFGSEVMPQYRTFINPDGALKYGLDEKGDRIPDFSFCGYKASEKAIPDLPVKVVVRKLPGDATMRIQTALNYVSSLPLDENGFRGAVLLEEGVFDVEGSLTIQSSGVVLRGSGCGASGTMLKGMGVGRETLIRITGKDPGQIGEPVSLASQYFPVNTSVLIFQDEHPFNAGDQVIVNRPSHQEWLERIGADRIGGGDFRTAWAQGDFDINWDRRVIAVSGKSITLDAPITNALDPALGGGSVSSYSWEGRLKNVGVENLSCLSEYDPSNEKDENHRWMAITLDNVSDAWVRRVETRHFVSSAVAVWETCKRVTVEDCKSLSPVGEIGNFRRYAFHSLGQQVLFQRCYAEYGYHAFSVGFTAPGPNAFVQCYSFMPSHFSGAIGGWATAILFDKVTVDGGSLSFAYRDIDGQGGGWSAANSMFWQCRAAKLYLPSPPTAQNWAYGNWAQPYGNGHHERANTFLKPESLFYAQLNARTGERSAESEKILIYETDETTAPTPEMALSFSERSRRPDLTMDTWIDSMIQQYPILSDTSGAITFEEIPLDDPEEIEKWAPAFILRKGWIIRGNSIVTGRITRTSMWRGTTRPGELSDPRPNLVRFVPGRFGRGLTDDLDSLTDDMIRNQVFAIQHFPSLWYDRRRDDHSRTRRADADLWTPFYEQPFSRSGQGEAFDGLSRYDMSQWNPWYWSRLKGYADLADQKGLLLIQEHYLQHNIIEEGAHWVDYPWRSANNINDLGFAEPPHYAGDKRVYMAAEFYDTTHIVRKEFHRAYIRKSLSNFENNLNVIHHLGREYTGPLHFVEFWLDVIREWERETGLDVLVMLPGTREVQDAILSDPIRGKKVDVLDIIQWHYRKDGSLYAPLGGVSLAQRQYARIYDVGETSFDQVYHAVREYRINYPEKAVVYSRKGGELSAWAVFMAGGSFANLPDIKDEIFLETAAEMENYSVQGQESKQYALEKEGVEFIIFSESPHIDIDSYDLKNAYHIKWIHPDTGEISKVLSSGGKSRTTTLKAPFEGASVAWITVEK